ncbi:hypothetical protein ZIOFF_070202 [Zingiber officinale]|uniref:Uncharacterized protein n=2 Tax=Zingiber officinale TaxID=94328 RepID=A0A8J5C588_ZINOF|nr:hypothetical protein ZIOFF_070202 [Zingiber officinale]
MICSRLYFSPLPCKKASSSLLLYICTSAIEAIAFKLPAEIKAMRGMPMHYSTSSSSSGLCNFSGDRHLLGMAMVKSKSTSPVNVTEEYYKTLRTKSFLDMWSKVHDQSLRRVSSVPIISGDDKNNEDSGGDQKGLICGSSPLASYGRLPDFVLDPSQETVLAQMTAEDDRAGGGQLELQVKSLLVEYFDVTLRACFACANLLAAISSARLHHRLLRRFLIKLSSGAGDAAFDHVASLVDLENPLHPRNLAQFYSVQSDYGQLAQKLTRAHRRILRRARLHRVARQAAGVAAVVACGIATVIAVAIAAHTGVCIGAVAVATPTAVVTGRQRRREVRRAGAWWWLKSLAAQVDAAARGAYIVGRDLETMTRMVRRAHDELEHVRWVAGMAARGREEPQMLREAAREVERGTAGMAEQLNELEEHVNLCLITINRSRKMVAEELMAEACPAPDRPA